MDLVNQVRKKADKVQKQAKKERLSRRAPNEMGQQPLQDENDIRTTRRPTPQEERERSREESGT